MHEPLPHPDFVSALSILIPTWAQQNSQARLDLSTWFQQNLSIIISDLPFVKLSRAIFIWCNIASPGLGTDLGLEKLTISSLSCHSTPGLMVPGFLLVQGKSPVLWGAAPWRNWGKISGKGCCSGHYSANTDSVLSLLMQYQENIWELQQRKRKQPHWNKSICTVFKRYREPGWGGSGWTDPEQEQGQEFSLHHCSSCSNTNMSANYLLDPHKHSYISDRSQH